MTNQGALQGVRVADFGWVLAGPYATMLLGYMGAEVIKIESRRRPDEQRIAHRAGFSSELDASSNFLEVNFNKKSVTLNLSTPEGAELARQIVATSDVVVENMRPGVMNRLGLGYPDLSAVKPDIIMVSISGWGQSGPLREYTAYAPCFASFGGLAHLIGYADGEPNTGTSAMDARSGTAAAFAALMALNIRQRTGQGQYIDLASGEALSCLVGDATMEYVLTGQSPARAGNRDTMMAPHNCYRCQGDDKWISIAFMDTYGNLYDLPLDQRKMTRTTKESIFRMPGRFPPGDVDVNLCLWSDFDEVQNANEGAMYMTNFMRVGEYTY